jgi:hypothetical protein
MLMVTAMHTTANWHYCNMLLTTGTSALSCLLLLLLQNLVHSIDLTSVGRHESQCSILEAYVRLPSRFKGVLGRLGAVVIAANKCQIALCCDLETALCVATTEPAAAAAAAAAAVALVRVGPRQRQQISHGTSSSTRFQRCSMCV